MKLAVTGGSGFLGYHLCNMLADKFDEIVVIDIAPLNPSEYPKNVKYYESDVRDFELMMKLLSDVDQVVHGAAALPLWSKKDIFTTNVDGTRNILEASRRNKVERVIYVSSTAVYGVPDRHPIFENDPLIGIGPYGESKIQAEYICKEYRKNNYCVPIVRPKTFIGTGRLGVFQILYDWIESGAKIPIIGNGKNEYQLLEVSDLVDAIYLMLTLPCEKINENFNIGAKTVGQINEFLGALCDHARSGSRVMRTPSWLVKPALEIFWALRISPLYKWVYGTADKDSYVSIEKAEKQLGWAPKFSNAEALIRSYKWYLENKDSLETGSGVTHRVAWKQGILNLFKKFM